MRVLRGYKYRIYPTPDQEQLLKQMVGNSRYLWNQLLGLNNTFYERTKKFLWYRDLNEQIKRLKQEFDWLRLSNSQSLQQVGMQLDRAVKDFLKQPGKGYPRFKKKAYGGSLLVPQHFKINKKSVTLPKIKKPIKMIKHRPIGGKPKSVTVSLDVDQWFISILCEVNVKQKQPGDLKIGIDLGLNHFYTDNNGNKVDNPRLLKKSLRRLTRQQRRLSKRVKGSNNKNKQRKIVAKTHRKVRRQRSDFHHKLSTQLIAKASVICVEDLNVAGMKRSKLGKSISDAGWSSFLRMLEYKSVEYGSTVVKIDRWFPSSKKCSGCGSIKKDLKRSDRVYKCHACGLILDRDLNAAINILVEGLTTTVGTTGSYACGDTSTGGLGLRSKSRHVSLKQEQVLVAACN